MTQFIRILTAVTILVHTTVGCCAHEGCSLGGEAHGAVCSHHGAEHAHGHSHGGDIESACDHQEPEQPSRHECSHAKCKWFAPEMRESGVLLTQSFAASLQWQLPDFSSAQLVEGCDSLGSFAELSTQTLPVRAHLLHSVLLI